MQHPSFPPGFAVPAEATVTTSCIEGLDVYDIPGNDNIDDDPLFADAENHDLHLTSTSPCINGGSNDVLPADFGDLNANSNFTERLPRDLDVVRKRVLADKADMGAFEFGCNADLLADCDIDATDLAILLDDWTGDDAYEDCPPYRQSDLNEDCKVNGTDLAILLNAWGECPDCSGGELFVFSGPGGGEDELLQQFLQWLLEADWQAFLDWAAAQE